MLHRIGQYSLHHIPRVLLRKIVKELAWRLDYLKSLVGGGVSDKVFTSKSLDDFQRFFSPLIKDSLKSSILDDANSSLNHAFNLLGSGDIKVHYYLKAEGLEEHRYDMHVSEKDHQTTKRKIFSTLEDIFGKRIDYEPIDWQIDFKSGYRWPENTFYKCLKYAPEPGADVKVSWELSRMQHLIGLALAFRVTGAARYAQEIIAQLVDWILSNPYKFGVNWQCTMEVAIRVANWTVAVELISNYLDKLTFEGKKRFEELFLSSLYQHGDFIIHNLEINRINGQRNNHYLANIAGLLVLSVATEDIFKEAAEWKRFAIEELKREISFQVYPDGTNFEASTCYHRLALELFFYPVWWLVIHHELFNKGNYQEVASEVFGEEFMEKLYKMFEAVLYLLKPNGRLPQIGDNDNGQFFKLYPREVLDMRYLLALGAVFFREPRFKISELFQTDEDIAELMLLYGEEGLEIWNKLAGNEISDIKSRSFPDSGWYIMRNGMDYVIISCGPNGKTGTGGHTHNDKLSYEFMRDGKDIVVDPGSYVYTPLPEERNRFRSTAYHNTISLEGKEQNRFVRLFAMEENAIARCLRFGENEQEIFFEGVHSGFNPVVHRRRIIFDKGKQHLQVYDELLNLDEERWANHVHFHPDVNLNNIHLGFNDKAEKYYYSEGYGEIQEAIKISSCERKYKV